MKPPQPAMLWFRDMGDSAARMIPGTEDASTPFWSPDSRYVAFFARGKLLRMDRSGGNIKKVMDVPDNRGGTWGTQGVIVYAPVYGGLMQVPAEGGESRPLTRLNQTRKEGGTSLASFPARRQTRYLSGTWSQRCEPRDSYGFHR
jgi:eukaryotic-like serine/threonine-protein kinase